MLELTVQTVDMLEVLLERKTAEQVAPLFFAERIDLS